jgi:hypothetical protein
MRHATAARPDRQCPEINCYQKTCCLGKRYDGCWECANLTARTEGMYAEKQKVFSISDYYGFLFPYVSVNWLGACLTEIENQFILSIFARELVEDKSLRVMHTRRRQEKVHPTRDGK